MSVSRLVILLCKYLECCPGVLLAFYVWTVRLWLVLMGTQGQEKKAWSHPSCTGLFCECLDGSNPEPAAELFSRKRGRGGWHGPSLLPASGNHFCTGGTIWSALGKCVTLKKHNLLGGDLRMKPVPGLIDLDFYFAPAPLCLWKWLECEQRSPICVWKRILVVQAW